jgi:hypothetical protein
VSDTPRTLQEECYGTCWAACERIEELEAQVKAYANRIKRLEEAGNKMAGRLYDGWPDLDGDEVIADMDALIEGWNEAKEDKP